MAIDNIGSDDATKTGSVQTWTRRDGEVLSETYEGPIDAINTLYGSLKNSIYDSLNVRRDGGMGTLELTYSEDSQTPALNDIWELLGREVVKDLRTHQDFNQSADQEDIDKANTAINTGTGGIISTTGWTTAAVTYLAIRLRGTTQYVRSQPILRRSIRTSDRGILDIAWEGVDRAWKLSGESGSPSPPSDLVGNINGMPEADAAKRQWLKKAPQKRQVTRQLYEVSFEWHFARDWSVSLYGGTAGSENY